MKRIATPFAFLIVFGSVLAEAADCRLLAYSNYRCGDELIFRRLPDGGFEMSDTELFHMLPDGAAEMRGFGRLPAGAFHIERKNPVSRPPTDEDIGH